LKIIHHFDPNVVQWNKVRPADQMRNVFDYNINCGEVIRACKELKIKVLGLDYATIVQGDRKTFLVISWGMRYWSY